MDPVVRRFLMEKLRDRMLEMHGAEGLIKWLFAGHLRPNGERIPFAADMHVYWEALVEEFTVWYQARRADNGDPPAPSSPPEGSRE